MPARFHLRRDLLLAVYLAGLIAAFGQIDRHPESKSRAVAWTAYDGSYLVDTSSRPEMTDFFWNVFNQPHGDHGWTGSVNPPVAGATSAKWRQREYAQLNAYRALNGSPSVTEDASKLDYVQAAALLFAQNPDKDLTHVPDASYVGWNATAADAARNSLLNGSGDDTYSTEGYIDGSADTFIADAQTTNSSVVGHRMYLLHDNSTSASLGSAVMYPGTQFSGTVFVNVWNTPLADQTADLNHFIAYPSPGYFPLPMVPKQYFRWSFVPANDWTAFRVASNPTFYVPAAGLAAKDTTVTATINGVVVPVNNLVRNNPPGPLTWDFGTYLDFANGKVADGTTVDIAIYDVAILDSDSYHVIGYRDYHYTVTLFDPSQVVPGNSTPRTPLVNISTRGTIGAADQQMIAGFTVAGTTPVRVALRTQGPGLTKYGVSNAAKSTHIRVYDQATQALMGENTGWKTHPSWRLLQSLQVAPAQDNEAGMLLTLWPGSYTAVVSDDTNANGVGIVEAFDIDNLTESKLVNLSTRGTVGTGENQMIAGIIVNNVPRTVVIRTQGPGLTKYGVSNVVNDTLLTLVAQSDGHTVATNDDWQTDSRNARLGTDLAAFAPTDAREAALVVTLAPGAYTALVSAKGTPGVGIVEVFDLTP
jgi:hypothetical protein